MANLKHSYLVAAGGTASPVVHFTSRYLSANLSKSLFCALNGTVYLSIANWDCSTGALNAS